MKAEMENQDEPVPAPRRGGIDDRDRGRLVAVITRGDGMELRVVNGHDLRGRPIIYLRLFRPAVEGGGFIPVAGGGCTLRFGDARGLRAALDAAIDLFEGEGRMP